MLKFLKIFKKNVPQVSKEVPIELLKASLKNFEQYKYEKEIRDEIKCRQDLTELHATWLGNINYVLENVDLKILEKNQAVKNGLVCNNKISLHLAFDTIKELYFYQMLKESIVEKFGSDVSDVRINFQYRLDAYSRHPYFSIYLNVYLSIDGLNKVEHEPANLYDLFDITVDCWEHEIPQFKVDMIKAGRDIQTNLTEESFKFLNESQPNV